MYKNPAHLILATEPSGNVFTNRRAGKAESGRINEKNTEKLACGAKSKERVTKRRYDHALHLARIKINAHILRKNTTLYRFHCRIDSINQSRVLGSN